MEIIPKPHETVLFSSDAVAIASFRCPFTAPRFRDSGPCSYHTFAFPRSSTAIRHEGGTRFVGTPNSVVFYNLGQRYQRERIDPVDATDWYVVADDILLEALRSHDPWVDDRPGRPFPFSCGPCDPRVYFAQRMLFEQVERGGSVSVLGAEETILGVLDAVLAAAYENVHFESPRMRDAVEHVKQIVAADPGRAMTLRVLAAAAGCSPYHLCRAFRRLTGQTITAFRRSMRLRLALLRLRDGAVDLTDLALELGFASHSHFTAAFREHFGVTPSRFRAIG